MNKRVIVGIGARDSGHAALEWALEFAEAHHAEVELVHVADERWSGLSNELSGEALLAAEHDLRTRAEQATAARPGVHVHPSVVEGVPVDALVERSTGASLLVLGTHPLKRFKGLVFSTRASHIAALARCSVVVVPETQDPSCQGVVVGIDGSTTSAAAAQFAATEADRLGEPLRAIYAWRTLSPWTTDVDGRAPAVPGDGERIILSEALAGIAEQFPDLRVDEALSAERPSDALISAALGARMLVVGTHGRRGVARLLLGSVSHEMLLRMPCPVAVIRVETGGAAA